MNEEGPKGVNQKGSRLRVDQIPSDRKKDSQHLKPKSKIKKTKLDKNTLDRLIKRIEDL